MIRKIYAAFALPVILVLALKSRHVLAGSSNMRSAGFNRKEAGTVKMFNVSPISNVRSTTGCAIMCLESPDCTCYRYDNASQQCDLGTDWLVLQSASLSFSSTPGDVFVSWDVSAPWTWLHHDQNINSWGADIVCLDIGGKMLQMKSPERWARVQTAFADFGQTMTYVGINDFVTQGVIRWAYDDTILDDATKAMLFIQGEPDANGRCAILHNFNDRPPGLTDERCSWNLPVFCEFNPPNF